MFSYLKELFATAGTGSFEWILICLYIGILLACGAALYDRRLLGNYIRKLVSLDATVPERAVTLKEAGFEVTDHIRITMEGSEKVTAVAEAKKAEITSATLAESLTVGTPVGYTKEWDLNGEKATLGVEKI